MQHCRQVKIYRKLKGDATTVFHMPRKLSAIGDTMTFFAQADIQPARRETITAGGNGQTETVPAPSESRTSMGSGLWIP